MAFSASRADIPAHLSLVIHTCLDGQSCDCQVIGRSDEVKYLGLFLDSNLKLLAHINYLNKRLRKTIFLIRELSSILPRRSVMQIYYSLCQSLLLYGNLGWGGASKTALDPLNKTQKLILKIIFRLPRLYPTNQLYSETGVLTARQLYIQTAVVHFRKHFRQESVRQHHEHSTRHRSEPVVPRMNTRFGQRHYYYLGPKLFTQIPQEIKFLVSLSKFKKGVQNWIREMGVAEEEGALLAVV